MWPHLRASAGRVAVCACLAIPLLAQQPPPDDPFAGLSPNPEPVQPAPAPRSPLRAFFTENFGFRKEVMSQFTWNEEGHAASRQSLGFEVLKKFSTATATVAAFNFQGRFVRRDGFNPVRNDMEGQTRPGWFFEYHNAYLDIYNIAGRRAPVGRVNLRAGRFYLPFGLNLQTDTHGPVLQLSNDRNFGFERDWYTGLWGSLNRHLNYDAYYLAGSGYDLHWKGQRGLAAIRLSLASLYSNRYGLEGGVSYLNGERLDMERRVIGTRRAGLDARYRRTVRAGLLTLTGEASRGDDNGHPVTMLLNQAGYLHRSRRWGADLQYRRFAEKGFEKDAALIAEFTWYFRNDVGNSNLHWVKWNVEHNRQRTIFTLQYYFYR